MSRRTLPLFILMTIIVAAVWAFTRVQADPRTDTNQGAPSAKKNNPTSGRDQSRFKAVSQKSIFIPYWNIPNSLEDTASYDELYYFGIAPDEKGEVMDDSGLRDLGRFVESTSNDKKRFLTIRMLNTEINSSILQDLQTQDRLISQTLGLVGEHDFDGVVLDLEMSVIPFDDVSQEITSFVNSFSDEAQRQNKSFYLTIHGDTFYRGRPYDIEKLEPLVDRFLVMAYDFHKSRGEPGPNFPFSKRSEPPLNPLLGKEGNERGGYGYDFQTMVSDFTSVVPVAKITVLFGMYGYDWTLGPQGLPLKAAKAVPLNQIDAEGAIVDPISKEKYIEYRDGEGFNHVLWYEDEESVEVKIQYLREQGIGSVGYWVFGYY